MSNVDFEKHQREELRWRMLKVLLAGAPWPVSEGLLQAALDDAALRVTPSQLRKELRYLADKQLVIVHQQDQPVWLGQLTALGTDVVEYAAACPQGIRRPDKWY